MSAIDGHKVDDFDLQKLAPAGSKAYKELWPAGNTRLTWLVIQKSQKHTENWDLPCSAGPFKFSILLRRSGQRANTPSFPPMQMI